MSWPFSFLRHVPGERVKSADINELQAAVETVSVPDPAAATPGIRTLGTGAAQAAAGNDARLSDARVPTAHATTHQPGGSDALAIDAAAATGSLRTLGTNPTQAAAGNDSRLTNARTPTAHAVTHQAGGSDALPVDGAVGVASLRTLGTGAAQAAAGNDARLSDARTPTAHVLTGAAHTASGLTTGQVLTALSATTFGFRAPQAFDVRDYGAVGDGQVRQDGAMTNGSATLTVGGAAFTVADVGKVVSVAGAGGGGTTNRLLTTISAYVSTTQVTLAAPATHTITAALVVWGTNNYAAVNTALGAMPVAGAILLFPQGIYCIGDGTVSPALSVGSNLTLRGVQGAQSAGGHRNPWDGSTLAYFGPANGILLSASSAHHLQVDGINLFGAGGSGVTGLWIDATAGTNWATNACCYERMGFYDLTMGIQWGTSPVSDYQHDGTVVRQCYFRVLSSLWTSAGTPVANPIQAGSTGIKVYSGNAAAYSSIEDCIFQLLGVGIDVPENGGLMAISRCTFGACTTVDMRIGAAPQTVIQQCQGEGGTKFLEINVSLSGSTLTLLANRFDEPATINGICRVISIGNDCNPSGAAADQGQVIGAGTLTSLDDRFHNGAGWTLAANGAKMVRLDGDQLAFSRNVGGTVRGTAVQGLLRATASWTPGAIADNTVATKRVACTGALAGDVCLAGISVLGSSNAVISATVVVNDNVDVTLLNKTGGSWTPGTLSLTVLALQTAAV
jgi:hypothetical protein